MERLWSIDIRQDVLDKNRRIVSERCSRFSVVTLLSTMATIGYLGEDLEVPITSMFDVYKNRGEHLDDGCRTDASLGAAVWGSAACEWSSLA